MFALLAATDGTADPALTLMIVLGVWAALGWAGWGIGKSKGKAGVGLALGLLLGIFGLIIIACIPESAEHKMATYQQMAAAQAAAQGQYAPPVSPVVRP